MFETVNCNFGATKSFLLVKVNTGSLCTVSKCILLIIIVLVLVLLNMIIMVIVMKEMIIIIVILMQMAMAI